MRTTVHVWSSAWTAEPLHSGAHSVSPCMQAAREGKLAQLTSREGRRLASLLAKLGQLEDAHAVAQVPALRDSAVPLGHSQKPCCATLLNGPHCCWKEVAWLTSIWQQSVWEHVLIRKRMHRGYGR